MYYNETSILNRGLLCAQCTAVVYHTNNNYYTVVSCYQLSTWPRFPSRTASHVFEWLVRTKLRQLIFLTSLQGPVKAAGTYLVKPTEEKHPRTPEEEQNVILTHTHTGQFTVGLNL